MTRLPPELQALVEELVERARLKPPAARDVRGDLEQHLLDGLARGRSVDQLAASFGDPERVAPLLARSRQRSGGPVGRSDGWLTSLVADVRLAVRGLGRAPGLAAVSIVVLALGVGANAVVFTVLNELLLRPLPVAEPEGLVDVWADIPGGNSFLGVSYQDFLTYRAEAESLEELVAFTGVRLAVGDEGVTADAVAQLVSPGYFEMLGLDPTLGSLGLAGGAFGAPPVAVVSHGYWTESYGADPGVVGRTLRVQDTPVTVVGVAPRDFRGHFIGFPSDLWLPITAANPLIPGFDPDDRMQKPFEMIGRLRTGADVVAAQSELNEIATRIESAYPDFNRGHRLGVTPTTGVDHSMLTGVRIFVLILTVVSTLILVIACLNVGSVLLVRAMSRDRELAVRVAIGAGSGRLVRQLLTESAVLVGLGAALGIGAAARANRWLAELFRVVTSGLGLRLELDWRVIGLSVIAALLAAAVASAAPLAYVLGRDPASALRGRIGPTRAIVRLRSAMVVGQVAVSVVLVVATGLFARALSEGGRVDPGFEADRVASFALTIDPDLFNASEYAALEATVLSELRSIPGIEGVAIADGPPIGVARSPMFMDIPGVPPPTDLDRLVVDVRRVGPQYMTTLGITLLRGRDLGDEDDEVGTPAAIVSEGFRRRYLSGSDPLGRSFTLGADEVRIVGVAEDARYIVHDATPDPVVYLSRAGERFVPSHVTVAGEQPERFTEEIGAIVASRVPRHRPVEPRVARGILDDALLPQRLGTWMIGAMGSAALFLAAVGLFGLIQFTVSRDTHELGVRLALGGDRADLAAVVLGKGFRLVAIGAVIGLSAAALAAPGLGAFLTGVSPFDPLTYGAVVACFVLVALVASWIPARRALRIEPTEALREG